MAGSFLPRGYIGPATDVGSSTATSLGTTLTSGTTNTKGSYTQLVASTTRDTDYILLSASNSPSNGFRLSIDLAVGGAGSEQIILPDFVVSSGINSVNQVAIPISIPAGTRLSARCQSSAATDQVSVNVVLCAGSMDFQPYDMVDTYGFTSGSTTGVTVDPGGTINTKGSYTQIVASTTRDHMGLFFIVDAGTRTVGVGQNWLIDVAVGAAASEQVLIPNIMMAETGSAMVDTPSVWGPYPVQVPAGTRLSVRAQCTENTAASRVFHLTTYGLS